MFDISLATSQSSLEQLKKIYTYNWKTSYNINYRIVTLFNLWYYTSTKDDTIVKCLAYYQYEGQSDGYYSAVFLYDTTTGLYDYGVGSGVQASSTDNGISSVPGLLDKLTLYYTFVQYTSTATASASATSTASATATGNTPVEANNNAHDAALTSAKFSLATLVQPPPEQKSCEQFCLSCIDFRFVSDLGYYQNVKGKINNYDQFILAGASLGYNGIPDYENWTLCCDQHIQIARELHQITEVDLFDHLDCGAYRLVYTPEELEGDGEFKLHVENLNKAEDTIFQKYPFITKVNKFIFDLSYNAIPIP